MTNNPIKHSFHWPGACLGTLAKAVTYATSCNCCIRLRPSRFDVWTVKNSVSINFYILHLSIIFPYFSIGCVLTFRIGKGVLDPCHRPSVSLWSDELTVQIQQGPRTDFRRFSASNFDDSTENRWTLLVDIEAPLSTLLDPTGASSQRNAAN